MRRISCCDLLILKPKDKGSGKLRTRTKKRVQTFFVFLIVTATALFIECDVYFPDKINVFHGETFTVREGSPYTVDIAASKTLGAEGAYQAEIKLFGLIPVKNVEVDVLPVTEVLPGGKTVGIKLFTKGLMCVGTEKLTGENGATVDAEKQADLKSADMILRVDGLELHTIEQFAKIVEESEGRTLTLMTERNGETAEKKLTPVKTDSGYKLGIWVRDSTAGIGTVTFLNKKNGMYGALGHPITDVDTGMIMPVEQGSVSDTKIIDVKKGERGQPGELCGLFAQSGTDRGVIFKNTAKGIYGVMEENYSVGAVKDAVPVSSKEQVRTGKAEIYANVEGDKVERFEVEITKIMKHAQDDKNMVISVTDQRLLDITGGIVQGMSGSPVIQNGKLIGAVTHVFVNDPTRGYGIFIENMLAEAETMK